MTKKKFKKLIRKLVVANVENSWIGNKDALDHEAIRKALDTADHRASKAINKLFKERK